jgi:hypothetical protein
MSEAIYLGLVTVACDYCNLDSLRTGVSHSLGDETICGPCYDRLFDGDSAIEEE